MPLGAVRWAVVAVAVVYAAVAKQRSAQREAMLWVGRIAVSGLRGRKG